MERHFNVPPPSPTPPRTHKNKCVTWWWSPHPIINIIELWQFWKVKSQNGFSDFSFSPVDPLTVDYQKGRDPGDWIWKRNAENNFTLILVFPKKIFQNICFPKWWSVYSSTIWGPSILPVLVSQDPDTCMHSIASTLHIQMSKTMWI